MLRTSLQAENHPPPSVKAVAQGRTVEQSSVQQDAASPNGPGQCWRWTPDRLAATQE